MPLLIVVIALRPQPSGPDHLPGVDDLVKPLLVDVAGLQRDLFQGQAFVIRLVRNGGSVVVPAEALDAEAIEMDAHFAFFFQARTYSHERPE